MNSNEAEKIIKDTIEYANKEIEKTRKKSKQIICAVLLGILAILAIYFSVFVYETPVKYQKELIDITHPTDNGIDIRINLSDYKRAYSLLSENDEGYDLYIGVTQTFATKLSENTNKANQLLRVGNGMVVDYHSERLLEYIPDGKDENIIQRIYYIGDKFETVTNMSYEELSEYENKVLIWER